MPTKQDLKESYAALVAKADRAAEKHQEEIALLQNKLYLAREEMSKLEMRVDLAIDILHGKEGE